ARLEAINTSKPEPNTDDTDDLLQSPIPDVSDDNNSFPNSELSQLIQGLDIKDLENIMESEPNTDDTDVLLQSPILDVSDDNNSLPNSESSLDIKDLEHITESETNADDTDLL